jgi:hypothetical protein
VKKVLSLCKELQCRRHHHHHLSLKSITNSLLSQSAWKLHRMQKLTPFYKVNGSHHFSTPPTRMKHQNGRGVRAGERKTITVFFFKNHYKSQKL